MTLALAAYAEGHPPPLNADARVQTLSGGQQRRLDLAFGILGSPRLLFLNEPTTGFDPGARRGAWQLVRDLRDQGTMIVLTTHYLEEAEALTDRVVLLAAGEVVAEGAPAELGGRSDGPTAVRFRVGPGAVLPALPASDGAPGGRSLDDGPGGGRRRPGQVRLLPVDHAYG